MGSPYNVRAFAVIASAFFLQVLIAGEPNVFYFRYEGMHSKPIVSMHLDKTGSKMLTVGSDQSAKLWDASNCELIRTFYIGSYSAYLPAALSENGKMIAFGGKNLQVFGREMQLSVFVDNNFKNAVDYCVFSPDGKLLAVSEANTGISIYETAHWQKLHYIEIGNSKIAGMAFDVENRFYFLTQDGQIKIFTEDFQPEGEFSIRQGQQAFSMTVSNDGNYLAVGVTGNLQPLIYRSHSHELAFEPEAPSVTDALKHLTLGLFSPDGNQIYAIYEVTDPTGSEPGFITGKWDLNSKDGFQVLATFTGEFTAMVISPSGEIFTCNQGAEISKRNSDGSIIFSLSSKSNAFDRKEPIRVNGNADEVIFSFVDSPQFLLSLESKTFEILFEDLPATRYRSPRNSAPGLAIEISQEPNAVLLNNRKIAWIPEDEIIHQVDIADHGQRFVLGSDRHIYCVGRDGLLIWNESLPARVESVNISGNARVLLVTLDDASFRWYRMSDGRPLFSMLAYNDIEQWVMITASGFYDHSFGAENLGGIALRRAKSNGYEFVPLADFSETHYKPEVIDEMWINWDEAKALEKAGITAYKSIHELILPEEFYVIPKPALKKRPKVEDRFFLIVASFPRLDHAEELISELNGQGYPSAMVLEGGRRYRVALEGFDNFSEANAKRRELENTFRGIWVLDITKEN